MRLKELLNNCSSAITTLWFLLTNVSISSLTAVRRPVNTGNRTDVNTKEIIKIFYEDQMNEQYKKDEKIL